MAERVGATVQVLASDDVHVATSPGLLHVIVENVLNNALKRFQPFYRVPGTNISGTGIGLATVDRIVRAHGGQVRVESVAGTGTRFEIRLPLSGVEVGSRAV